jgi:hypothetical protein
MTDSPGQRFPIGSMVRLTRDVSVFAKQGETFSVAEQFDENRYNLKSQKGGWFFTTSGENIELVIDSPESTSIRTFDTGATRNTDNSKYDYEGFLSPLALKAFASYMHRHRLQKDGTLRASDNWQKGIPDDVYLKSLWRHFMDLWSIERGHTMISPDDGSVVTKEDALCALMFNVQGLLHEHLKRKESNAGTIPKTE